MPPAGSCLVCVHPDRTAIEAALRAGTPGVRATARQYKLKDHNVLTKHRRDHMQVVAPTPEEVARAKIAAIAPLQVARGAEAMVEQQRQSAAEMNLANQKFRMTIRKITMDLVNVLSGRGEDSDAPLKVEEVGSLINALRLAVQTSDSIESGIELEGKFSGELAQTAQVNVQVNVALAAAIGRVGEEQGRWLTEDVPGEVESALLESGLDGDQLERSRGAVVRRLVTARSALGARVAKVLDAEVVR